MILIDDREKDYQSDKPMAELFKGRGVAVDTVRLDSGDYMFEGNGPAGPVTIGIERKRVSDLLSSCLNGRISDVQAPRMHADFDRCYLIVEGSISVHWQTDMIQKFNNSVKRWEDWQIGSRTITGSTLDRFLLDFAEGFGLKPFFTQNVTQTVRKIVTLHNWWETPWGAHTGLKQFHETAPVFNDGSVSLNRPGGVARVAKEVPGVGWDTAMAIEGEFSTAEEFVLASVDRLMEVKWKSPKGKNQGIGKVGAEKIWEWWRKENPE